MTRKLSVMGVAARLIIMDDLTAAQPDPERVKSWYGLGPTDVARGLIRRSRETSELNARLERERVDRWMLSDIIGASSVDVVSMVAQHGHHTTMDAMRGGSTSWERALAWHRNGDPVAACLAAVAHIESYPITLEIRSSAAINSKALTISKLSLETLSWLEAARSTR